MAKAAKEIQMENPKELETQSAGTTCSPSEEQAEKPSMLCFKKRKKSCKKGLTVKDACEGASAASEEKSQCIGTDKGEAKVSAQPRSSRGAWAAIKSLTRPRRRQKSSSRKKEGGTQGSSRKKASSGVKMPCVRFSRGKKKRSLSEAVEESEGSVQANEEMGISNKAIEELEDLAPAEEPSKAEPSSPLPVEEAREDKGMIEEGADAGVKSEPLAEPRPDVDEHAEHTTQSEITSSEAEAVDEHTEHTTQSQITSPEAEREVPAEVPVSTEQPNNTPEITEVQEIANICKELPEGGESEENTNLPEESKAEETVMDFSQSAFKDEAASVQSSSSHQEKPEINMGTCVGIVITVTESSGSFDLGQKGGPEAGSSALAEEKGLGDQGHRTSDQYELLLIETASSLVKAAIQSSIEQLVNEMALEQNKHNSFL
uniref:A-kinase anchoring protein 5 n=1 Tax=Anas platyrhynchos TaxID=8839 RepID=A0A8B9TN20_ANAPL